MRGIVTGLAVSTLLISVLPATAGNPQPAVAAQSPERLIDQLGDRDFRVRETAGKALEKMGPAALPALRKARGHADLEVRRRVAQLTQAAERLALLTPQRVTLRISHKSLQEVFAEMSRQTGYKIHFVNEGNGGPKTVYSFDLADVTFWEALDRICATAGLVLAGHGEDGALQAFATDSYVPHVHRVGPFRIKVANCASYSSLDLAALPRRGFDEVRRRESWLTYNLELLAEPKLKIVAVGAPENKTAEDDLHASLLLPTPEADQEERRFMHRHYYGGGNNQVVVQLARATKEASKLRLLKGTIPVTLLLERRPEVTVEKLSAAVGKKFRASDTELTIEKYEKNDAGEHHVTVHLQRSNKSAEMENVWANTIDERLQILDAKGKRCHYNGHGSESSEDYIRCTYTFPAGRAGAPVKLVYSTWVTFVHKVPFEFKNLPLP